MAAMVEITEPIWLDADDNVVAAPTVEVDDNGDTVTKGKGVRTLPVGRITAADAEHYGLTVEHDDDKDRDVVVVKHAKSKK